MYINLGTPSSYPASVQRPPKNGGPVEDAAKALGMTPDDVMSQLRDGKSLGDIADEKGVSRDTLATALKAGMPADRAASGDSDKAVDKIIDQVGTARGPRGPKGPPPPPPASSSSSTGSSGVYGDSLTTEQQSTLAKLADLLGTDSGSLLGDLKSGTSLSSMLADKDVSREQLAGVVQNGLLIDARA